jgi:hypothetical protein
MGDTEQTYTLVAFYHKGVLLAGVSPCFVHTFPTFAEGGS